ncbi:MAG: hypothetical protein N2Z81_03360 [Hydrogenothermaceae bacterium]|nr:hypothetical protein [Hydrogenothermaceae bacterium]
MKFLKSKIIFILVISLLSTLKAQELAEKYLVISLLSTLKAQELAEKYEVKLIEKIVMGITGKSYPKICTVNYPVDRIKEYSTYLVISSCKQADMVIAGTDELESFDKPILLIGDTEIKDRKDVIGAIFWKKGRPQIIFIDKNLKRFDIQIPREYNKYIIKKDSLKYAEAVF